MNFKQFLLEKKSTEKKDKIVFIETDPREPFPNDTLTYIEKEINKNCKDLEKEWKSAIDVVNYSFNELDVPIPKAFQNERWSQYLKLLSYAVKNLYDSRGFSSWTRTIN